MTTSNATMTSVTIKRGRRGLAVGIAATAAVGLFLGGLGATASAAPGLEDDDSTTANVAVLEGITLTGLTDSFTLTGPPGATAFGIGAVTMNVETNNVAGYNVTVQSGNLALAPVSAGNLDEIPIASLTVRETTTAPYFGMAATARVVHTQATRSLNGGDELSNDYQIRIPVVDADVYTATLDYVATTL